jgi:TP901 family phage tail tape measure protein
LSIQAAALYATVGVTGAGQSVRELGAVSGAVDATQKKLTIMGRSSQGVGKGVSQIAGGLVKVGEFAVAALGIATVAAGHTAASFQADMELIHTQAGASQAEVDKMSKSVQDMVHDVGTGPDELAKGQYHIESVGVRGAAALDILKASAIGARVGLADMDSVTNALTAVWFSGIKGAKSMTDAMAILDGVVGVGNMHLQDLTDSFKSGILGTAATFGVDIRSLGAAIATLTDAGVPANIAATRLNMTLSHMAAPVPKAIETLKKLGIGQFDLANDLRKPDGIFVALKDLHDHLLAAGDIFTSGPNKGKLTPQGADAMTKIFGGSRFGATAMQLLTAMGRIDQKYQLITERSTTFAGNVQATMATAGFKWTQFMSDVKESALSFGEGVLPSLVRALGKADDALVAHRADFVKFGQDMGAAIDAGIAKLEGIDWHGVQEGLGTVRDVVATVLDLIKQIPPQVTVAFAGLVGINKLAGGLLGKGAGNILGAGLNQFLGRGSPANPMWVKSVDGILGGGAGGAAAGGRGLLGSVLAFVPAIAVATAAYWLKSNVLDPQSAANRQQEADLTKQTNTYAPQASLAALNQSIAGLEGYMQTLENSQLSTAEGLAYALDIDGVKTTLKAQLAALLAEQTYLARAAAEGWGVQRTQPVGGGNPDAILGAGASRDKELSAAVTHSWTHALYDASSKILGTRPGTAATDKSIDNRLRYLASHANKGAITVADALVRHFVASNLPVYRSSRNQERTLAQLRALQQRFLDRGDVKSAAKIGHDIKIMETAIAAKTAAAAAKTAAAARGAGILAAGAIRDKDLSVTINPQAVNMNIDSHRVAHAIVRYASNPTLRRI